MNESNRTQFESCSEVVERLATECLFVGNVPLRAELNREKALAILHSWRERRVQELEEALRQIAEGCPSLRSNRVAPLLAYHEIKQVAETALSNSEQIRKGAKHE